jgi:hypothetical protein
MNYLFFKCFRQNIFLWVEYKMSIWQQLGLDIDGEAATDFSGYSVSLSADGTRVAIGAINNNGINGPLSGHVRVYQLVNSTWVKMGDDIDGEAGAMFIYLAEQSGFSVSLNGDGSRVAIGAIGNHGNGTNSGNVRVYSWNESSWVQMGDDIDGEAAGDRSGYSVSLSADGSRVAIGAIENYGNGSNSGHVRVYSWNGSSWVQMGDDIDGEATGDKSGYSVSLSADGSRVAIGAPYASGVNGPVSGHVRVYQFVNSTWVKMGDDIDGEHDVGDLNAVVVSLSADGTHVAIGASQNRSGVDNYEKGHVRVYLWNGSSWVQMGSDIDGELIGNENNNQFGYSVSLSADGSYVAISEIFGRGVNGNDSGNVRIYQYNESDWTLIGELDGEADYDRSGYSVSLSADGSRVAIGAPLNDENGSNSGHVRVYELSTPAPAPAPAPTPSPAPSPAPAPSATPTPVIINFNVTVDASSNLTIFGMSPPTEPADTIVAEYQLPVNALYDPSECLIEFWEEDNSENQIKCQLANVNTAASGGFDLSGAYQKTAKRLAHGLQKVLCNAFDCSKAAPYSENKYASVEYYKQRDFGRVALGTFAHYLFGHVDATAAITNDIGFITGMLSLNGSNAAAAATNEGVSGPAERYGAWSKVSEVANNNVQSWSTAATDSDVNLAIRLVKTIVNKGLSGGEPVEQVVTDISTIDATNNTLAYIAAQVLGQDATRMMGHDNAERAKNIHQPLKFISGDVIYMNIKLPMPSVTISPNAAGSASTNSLATKYVQERSYTLKITLGAADATLGGSNLDIALEIPGL